MALPDRTTPSTIQDKIDDDYKTAFKAKEEKVYLALRHVLAKIKQVSIDQRKELTNDEIIQILRSEIKSRKEAIVDFKRGDRQDLVDQAEYEIERIQDYLPAEMPDEELETIVKATIEEVGASDPADMGKLMGAVMGKVKGKVEGGRVKEMVEKLLK